MRRRPSVTVSLSSEGSEVEVEVEAIVGADTRTKQAVLERRRTRSPRNKAGNRVVLEGRRDQTPRKEVPVAPWRAAAPNRAKSPIRRVRAKALQALAELTEEGARKLEEEDEEEPIRKRVRRQVSESITALPLDQLEEVYEEGIVDAMMKSDEPRPWEDGDLFCAKPEGIREDTLSPSPAMCYSCRRENMRIPLTKSKKGSNWGWRCTQKKDSGGGGGGGCLSTRLQELEWWMTWCTRW